VENEDKFYTMLGSMFGLSFLQCLAVAYKQIMTHAGEHDPNTTANKKIQMLKKLAWSKSIQIEDQNLTYNK
jgi:hypothetical protein